jgi:gamma-glutamylputrescine oxidase
VTSYWLSEPAPPRPVAVVDNPDVVVLGGGVTGCSAALHLAQAGLRVRLCEARQVATGASGRNGGFALRGGAMPFDVAVREFGAERALAFWRETEAALRLMAELAGDAFRPVGSYRLAVDEAEAVELRREVEALWASGLEAEWLDPLPERLVTRYAAGFRHPPDGALHPARWVRRLAGHAAAAGVEIRENERVTSVEGLAPHVVIATDGYGTGLLPELDAAITPTRGQVVATEPLDDVLFPCPHYARHGYDYWHQLPDRRLVFGGHRDSSPGTEETDVEETTSIVQSHIDDAVEGLIGYRPAVAARWAGVWGTTADERPLVGPLAGRPGVWVAAGYCGHGNVMGLMCGSLVARAIKGDRDPLLDLFDPARSGALGPERL